MTEQQTVEVSVVVPAHREGERIERLHAAVVAALPDVAWELVLVDDGSPDDTWDRIRAVAEADDRVRGVRLSRNFGKEAAMAAGLAAALGHAVVTMDADLQHPPSVLPQLVAAWRAGADVVDGVKASRTGQGLLHRAASRTFNAVFTRATGVSLNEASDFKLLDRAVVDELVALPERATFYRGLASWVGFEHATVVFDVAERDDGESRWRPGALVGFAVDALTSFSSTPLQLVSVTGGLAVVFGVLFGIQTLVRYATGDAVEGFTTVILLQLLLGGLVLLGLGVQGAYLARIHQEVKARPRYIVRDEL
jgi:glycosyltransferase involved in cell wall biosynthesis